MTRLRYKILPEDVANNYQCAECLHIFNLGESFFVPGPLCSDCAGV